MDGAPPESMTGSQNEDWLENARMIVESARAIVPADGSLERVRKARFSGAGFQAEVMKDAAELGLFLMWVEEDNGGLGLGMRETCALMQVLGGGVLSEPVLSSMMAGALLQADFPEQAMLGEAVILTAWQDAVGSLEWKGGASCGRLTGRKVAVPCAGGADLFAVTTEAGVAVVPADAKGLEIIEDESLDGTHMGTLIFENVEASFLPADSVQQIIEDATLAHSAYLLGLSERALDITLDYLRVRKQFGRTIGSFQSLQHRATEMKIQLELLRAAIQATARRMDLGADALTRARGVSRCKLRAAELSRLVMEEAIQMHGAMGITDEADIGLFVRKSMAVSNLFGAPRQHKHILSTLLEGASQ